MDMNRALTAFFSILLAGVTGSAEPPSGPVSDAPPAVSLTALEPSGGFDWAWVLLLPPRELGSGDWRAWVGSDAVPGRQGRSRGRGIPGATVEVVERFLDERQERVLELNTTWAPILARSFQMGWQSPYTSQLLGEFMTMTAANLRPPTVPPVFYNCLIPYWVQQGWDSSLGSSAGSRVVITNTSSDRPMILYPGRR